MMKANPKHIEILKDVCKAPNDVIKFGDTIRLDVALAAMSVLQKRIDELTPITDIETSIRELAQMIHDSGLDHEFVTTMLDMFKSMAGLQATVKGKLDK